MLPNVQQAVPTEIVNFAFASCSLNKKRTLDGSTDAEVSFFVILLGSDERPKY